MKLKLYFLIFLGCFGLLEAVFVIGSVSFVSLVSQGQYEREVSKDFDRIFRANEAELVGNMMLKHQQLLQEQLFALSKRENLQLTLEQSGSNLPPLQVGNKEVKGLLKIFPISYGGVNYGKVTFVRESQKGSNHYFGWIVAFTFFQILLFCVVTYLIYRWSLRSIIKPLEQLIDNTRRRESIEGLSQDTTGIPAEIITIGSVLSDLWLEVKEQSQQVAIGNLSAQVAHDIRSPLAALDMVLEHLSVLPEDLRLIVRGAVGRIKDISNNLLESNRKTALKKTVNTTTNEKTSNVLLSSLIDPLVSEKRMQYRSKMAIEIQANLNSSYGLFAEIESTEFKRVLSNLINNATEAMGGQGKITVSVIENQGKIEIRCSDTGKGIPPEVLARLTERGETHGKAGGSGLGLYHARISAEKWGGTLTVESKVGHGTSVTISLPKASPPSWFVPELVIAESSTVVVLDDDSSIHQIWAGRFEKLLNPTQEIMLKHCSTSHDLINWVESQKELAHSTLLVDYELLGESKTGLDVIEELGIGDWSILVTSRFEEDEIRERCKKLGVKLIPKGLAAFVPILVQNRVRS